MSDPHFCWQVRWLTKEVTSTPKYPRPKQKFENIYNFDIYILGYY